MNQSARPQIALIAGIAAIAILSAACRVLSIPTLFRLWEFAVDLQTATVLIVVWYVSRDRRAANIEHLGLRSWKWQFIISALCAPAILLICVVATGFATKSVEYQGVENASTFCLSAFLDLPALFFFSVTTILLQEILFRGVILAELSQRYGELTAVWLSSSLWALLEAFGSDGSDIHFSAVLVVRLFYYTALGLLLAQMMLKWKSIWIDYSFRIGIILFSALLLTDVDSESNSFFAATSLSSDGRGWAAAAACAFAAFGLMRLRKYGQKSQFI